MLVQASQKLPGYFSQCVLVLCLLLFSFNPLIHGQGFTDVAAELGIQHSVSNLVLGTSGTVGTGGSGVSFFDFDNDGWDDITFLQLNDSLIFYKNVEGTLVQLPSAIYSPYETTQLLWVDYDNDGDYDAFLVTYNGTCVLYQNNGNFEFTDVTLEAGLDALIFTNRNYAVTFADYDRDGHLDFYLSRYHFDGDEENPLLTNALYRNNGDGTFSNVTVEAGVSNGIQPTFISVWVDVNNDLWPDLYVANDRSLWGNSLYINNGDGTFSDVSETSGTEMFGEDPMCAAFADFDNDGDLDIFCSNGGPPTKPPRFFVNQNDQVFEELGQQLGINVQETFMCSWGTSFIDVNNDGFLDIYVTTGLLTLEVTNEARSYLFMSNQGQGFIDSPNMFNSEHIAASYAVAKGDLDNDGFADLVVSNAKGFSSFIWQNEGASDLDANNWSKITLEGTASNKMAVGAWIHLHANESVYHHYTRCGDSFVSQDSQHHIFGIGNATVVDSIIVEYPSGHTDHYYNLPINQHHYLKEGDEIDVVISFEGASSICQGQEVTLFAGEHENYLWSTGETTPEITITEPGNYWVEVTNSFGVTVVSEVIELATTPLPVIQYDSVQPSCFGASDGLISLINTTGISAAEVNWNSGATGTTIDNLDAGIYSFEFIDTNGCISSGEIQLLEPEELIVLIATTPDNDGNGGGYDLFVFGGTPPYSLLVNGSVSATSENNLPPGNYQLQVIDANNCSYEEAFTIESSVQISNQNKTSDLQMYPNPLPSSEQLYVELNPMGSADQVLFFDLSGKITHAINLSESTTILRIPATDFCQSPGTYRVVFVAGNRPIKTATVLVLD